jgi:hypothetical protein
MSINFYLEENDMAKSGIDGVAVRGHTRCKQVGSGSRVVGAESGGLKTSGVSSLAMKQVGRNVARRNNQRSG